MPESTPPVYVEVLTLEEIDEVARRTEPWKHGLARIAYAAELQRAFMRKNGLTPAPDRASPNAEPASEKAAASQTPAEWVNANVSGSPALMRAMTNFAEHASGGCDGLRGVPPPADDFYKRVDENNGYGGPWGR